jgi:hypothetical protein
MITGGKACGAAASAGVAAACGAEGLTSAGSSTMGATEQPTKLPTIAANAQHKRKRLIKRNGTWLMVLILLEALLALLLFVVIVWWTMFSGRKKGELPPVDASDSDDKKP